MCLLVIVAFLLALSRETIGCRTAGVCFQEESRPLRVQTNRILQQNAPACNTRPLNDTEKA